MRLSPARLPVGPLTLVLAAAGPLAAQLALPPVGEYTGEWFRSNPYAADSAVHAYVIAQERRDRVTLGEAGFELASDNRRVVRALDERGFGEATVRVEVYAPKYAQST